MAFVMVAFDRGIFQRSVHPLDLPVRPGMVRFGASMLDAVFATDAVEQMLHSSGRRSVTVAGRKTKLHAVVGQVRMDFVGYSLNQVA